MNNNWEEEFDESFVKQEHYCSFSGSLPHWKNEWSCPEVKDFILTQINLAENRGLERAAKIAIEEIICDHCNGECCDFCWHTGKRKKTDYEIASAIRKLKTV